MEDTQMQQTAELSDGTETAAEKTDSVEETAAAEAEETAAPQKKISIFNEVIEILESMLVPAFVILLLFSYLMRPVTVDGRSMVPTLHDQDRLLMYRLFYTPEQGDIVVVSDYGGNVLDGNGNVVPSGYSLDENLIKRVIAVGGQKLEVRSAEGAVYVDDVRLDEPYIHELTMTDDRAFNYPITIPEGYVFVMGDNRNHSTDSRSVSVGLVKEENILGRAYFRYRAMPDTVEDLPKGKLGFLH